MGNKTQQKEYIETDPYCPTEGAMTSDDTPFIIERDKELPARDKHWIIIIGTIGYVLRVKRPAG